MAEPVSVHIQSFIDYLKFEKRYSPHTLISYEHDIRSFFDYLNRTFGETNLTEINSGFVRSWLAHMKEDKNSAKTINRKLSSLRSFFKYHLKRGAITAMPTVNVTAPKISRRLPVFVKETEARDLINSLNSTAENWKGLNARVLITLFYATGMRLSELIGLKEKQIDISRSQIRVLGKGNKERLIPVSGEIVKMIQSYQDYKKRDIADPDQDMLLVTEKGKKLYPKYAWLLVNEYLKGVSSLDKRSPHVLRHTFATHLMNNGADLNAVKELLGHSSLAATQVYTHNTIEKLKDVYKKAHPKA
jgi:integrase/recombinase XerC